MPDFFLLFFRNRFLKSTLAGLLVWHSVAAQDKTETPNDKMNKVFSYVAIPCTDFERAFKFYYTVTGGHIVRNENVPFPMAYFTDGDYNYVGHLFQLKEMKPHPDQAAVKFNTSADGVIVYLELARDLNETLGKVEKAGGSVIMSKTLIAPNKGYWALFLDTEGNKLALHSTD